MNQKASWRYLDFDLFKAHIPFSSLLNFWDFFKILLEQYIWKTYNSQKDLTTAASDGPFWNAELLCPPLTPLQLYWITCSVWAAAIVIKNNEAC